MANPDELRAAMMDACSDYEDTRGLGLAGNRKAEEAADRMRDSIRALDDYMSERDAIMPLAWCRSL